MRQAVMVAIAAGTLAATLLAVAAAEEGLAPILGVCFFGLFFFGIGLVGGSGVMVVAGLTVATLGAALGLDDDGRGVAAAAVVGIAAAATLVLTDASWWLRRQPEVDRQVVTSIALVAVPSWLLGAGVTAGIWWLTSSTTAAAWLLPLTIVILAAVTFGISERVRRLTRPSASRPGPSSRRDTDVVDRATG